MKVEWVVRRLRNNLRGCNELLDSDKSYDVKEAKDPLTPPIQPPYEAGMAKAKEAKAAAAGKRG